MGIKVLITGGTIDKRYNMDNGILHFSHSHIESLLKQGRLTVDIDIETLMLKDSLEMTETDRSTILHACENSEQDRILITHGTDTMVDTARFLETHLQHKTVVLTGAMIPSVFKDSDSLFNLGTAFGALHLLAAGIYIAMNGQVFKADNVVKNRQLGVFERLYL